MGCIMHLRLLIFGGASHDSPRIVRGNKTEFMITEYKITEHKITEYKIIAFKTIIYPRTDL